MSPDGWVDIAREDPTENGIYAVEIRVAGTGGAHLVRSEAVWSRGARIWFDKSGHPESELWMVMRWKPR